MDLFTQANAKALEESIKKNDELIRYKQEAKAKEQAQLAEQEYLNALNDPAMMQAYLSSKSNSSNASNQSQDAEFSFLGNNDITYTDSTGMLFDDETQKTIDNNNAQLADKELKAQQAIKTQTEQLLDSMPKRVRNTGLAYFDYKQDLTIADAYVAKILGLNISYIDLNANVNLKKTNVNQALSKMHTLNNAILTVTSGIDDYVEKDLGSTWDRLSRFTNRLTGWGLPFANSANREEHARNQYRIRGVAAITSDNNKVTVDDMKRSDNIMNSNWKDSASMMATTYSTLEQADHKLQEEINKLENMGFSLPEDERLKLQALKNLKKSVSGGDMNQALYKRNWQALKMLQENKGSQDVYNKALLLIYQK